MCAMSAGGEAMVSEAWNRFGAHTLSVRPLSSMCSNKFEMSSDLSVGVSLQTKAAVHALSFECHHNRQVANRHT